MEKSKNKIGEGLLWDIILAVLMLASLVGLFFPAASYKYRAKSYSLLGSSLLEGKTLGGGRVVLKPNIALWIAVVAIVVCAVLLLTLGRKAKKVVAEVQAIAAIIGIAVPAVLASKMASVLDGLKSVKAGYGLYIIAAVNLIILIFALKKLSDHKILCALDFMILPGMIYFLINNYIPMFGIYIAFKKVDYSVGLWKSPWVGLSNFATLFRSRDLMIITRNTLLYNAAFIILGILTGIIVGICLSEVAKKFLQRTYQTLILLPQLISFVIVAYIVYAFFAAEVGMVSQMTGLEDFYSNTKYWPFILIFINVWKQLGYNSIIFLSSIVGIDRSLYEAARVDGASKWKQIVYVTIPQLKPTIITLFVLQCGRIFYSDFGLFYQVPLNQGALYDATDTIDTFVYRALMVNNNISLASAASTYQAIVGFILVLVVNLIVRKVDKESAMF